MMRTFRFSRIWGTILESEKSKPLPVLRVSGAFRCYTLLYCRLPIIWHTVQALIPVRDFAVFEIYSGNLRSEGDRERAINDNVPLDRK